MTIRADGKPASDATLFVTRRELEALYAKTRLLLSLETNRKPEEQQFILLFPEDTQEC